MIKLRKVITTIAIVAVSSVIVIGCGGSDSSNKPTGFNDPAKLATDIQTLVNADLNDPNSASYSPGVTLDTVDCLPTGTDNEFTCEGGYSDGSTEKVGVTVSSDGKTYITH